MTQPRTAEFCYETLDLFAWLLAQVTITPTADDFEQQALKIAKARRELIAVLTPDVTTNGNGNRTSRRAAVKAGGPNE